MNDLPKRPILLALVAFILSAHALILPIIVVMFLFADADTPITINGEPALIGEHRLFLALSFVAWWCVAAALAVGIWKRKSWIRSVVTAVFLVPYVLAAVGLLVRGDILMFVIISIFAYVIWWYLYKKQSVVRFFEATS